MRVEYFDRARRDPKILQLQEEVARQQQREAKLRENFHSGSCTQGTRRKRADGELQATFLDF